MPDDTEVPNDWHSWRWQLRHRITKLEQLEQHIILTKEEIEGIKSINGKNLGLNITPYFLSLVDKEDPNDPIRRTMIPRIEETEIKEYEMSDPLCEDRATKVPGLVHRYPDRVLLLVTDACGAYCRYCTRRRLVGKKERALTWSDFANAVAYIKEHVEIRDVLISGGDPLLLENERLEKILKALYAIQHVEILRIGTKAPIVMPQRITSSLCQMLQRYRPLIISINIVHPKEITPEVKHACDKLSKSGIPLGSQTVLLKGVNDTPEIMKKLMHEQLKIGIRPYYIYQADLVSGTDHFRTSIDVGLEIMEKLRGWTTGYAIPTYVIDAPGGGGKIPIFPNYIIRRNKNEIVLKNYKGKEYKYVDSKA